MKGAKEKISAVYGKYGKWVVRRHPDAMHDAHKLKVKKGSSVPACMRISAP